MRSTRATAALLLCLAALPALSGDVFASNDPFFQQQWGLHRIQAEAAWGPGNRGSGVTVAVVDTGVNFAHEDLAGKSAGSFNCIRGTHPEQQPCSADGQLGDDNGHGTMVAGVAAAATNNGRGIASVAPSAGIMSLKALYADGTGDPWDVARAIRFAAGKARVINLSLGYQVGIVGAAINRLDSTFRDSIRYAASKGSVVVAASGNSYFASSYSGMADVLVVGASRHDDSRSIYSDSAQILAPGGSGACPGSPGCIWTTGRGDTEYVGVAGTSFAAPHVSGVAALLLSQSPGRGPGEVRNIILATADHVLGGPRVNAARAVGAPAAPASAGTDVVTGSQTQGTGPGNGAVPEDSDAGSPAAKAAAKGPGKRSASSTQGAAANSGTAAAGSAQTEGTLVLGASQGRPPEVPSSVAGSADGAGAGGHAGRLAGAKAEDEGAGRRNVVTGILLSVVAVAGGAFFWRKRRLA